MRSMNGIAVAAAILLLGGCAPVTFAPGGFTLGATPGAGYNLSQCGFLGAMSTEAARHGIRSAAIDVGAMRVRANQLQARFSSAYDARAERESWRSIASGEC